MIKPLFFILTLFCASICEANILNGHHQLIVVTSQNWPEMHGTLVKFERESDDSSWIEIDDPIPAVLGKSGLVWGIGLHPTPTNTTSFKQEGDNKSPAGIFTLGSAFGFASEADMIHLQVEYVQIDHNTEAVDDHLSKYYNTIVKNNEVIPDWTCSERMSSISLYEIGMCINHNFPNPQKGAGSAIFFHIWRHANSGTAGCTAMAKDDLEEMLIWLNKDKKPLLLQLPIHEYEKLQEEWELPQLKGVL
jgi:D-alanyl-D-alanine dipeptidase